MSTALLDSGRVEIKLAGYGIGPATALSDSSLLGKVQDYRRAAASRLYPLEGSAIAEKVPAAEFHISRKIDGEFTVLVYRQGEIFTLNPGGTVRVGLPVLDEAAKLLSKAKVKEALIACELYYARTALGTDLLAVTSPRWISGTSSRLTPREMPTPGYVVRPSSASAS
jgi:hypothetical protein